MLRRVLGSFKAGRRLLVINDEAHHCYLPRAKGRDTELDNSETENERAAVWFSGLRACTRRFQVRVVYDLSATPYYLSGSGFPAYSLFPWVVSDFGLIEAIEAGLVKIPFLPIDDSSQAIDEPVLKNLYENCKAELPRKGQRTQRREVQETSVGEAAPNLPAGRCAAATTLSTRRPASSRPSTRTSSASPSSCSRPARAATPSRPNTPRCARCVSETASKSASPTWSATACRPTATTLPPTSPARPIIASTPPSCRSKPRSAPPSRKTARRCASSSTNCATRPSFTS